MKIVWSVNPYDKKIPMAPMAKLLGAFGAKRQVVEAVYVADLNERELATDLRSAETRLKKAVAGAAPVSAATVIWEEKASQTAQVEELVHHAIAEHAAVIAAFSRGRRGVEGLYRGSFAELLTTVSPIPVLLANPDSRLPGSVDRVLYATDFSVAAQKAYAELLKLAAEASWQLIVFHAADAFQPASGTQAVLSRARLNRRRARIEAMARRAGVDVTVTVDDRMMPVETLVQEAAKTFDCDLICVAAQRRPARRMLLGSHTRRLLRESRVPVLVIKA